jgi:hypothetical protein
MHGDGAEGRAEYRRPSDDAGQRRRRSKNRHPRERHRHRSAADLGYHQPPDVGCVSVSDGEKPITATGSGAFTVSTNDGGDDGDFYFVNKGSVTFFDPASSLIINGVGYVLAADLSTLAGDMHDNPSGSFALAKDCDASGQAFERAPIDYFEGNFEGLGHVISNLKLRGGGHQRTGMFAQTGGSTIRDIYLKQVNVRSGNKTYVGALVGENEGTIINASVGGKVSGTYQFAEVGGLVGENQGTIERSRSSAVVSGPTAGGLVGVNWWVVQESFATGSATASSSAGGLVGGSLHYLANCYATGSADGHAAGGLAGSVEGYVSASYSVGKVSGTPIGGFVGDDGSGNGLTTSYWDLDTSGVTDPSQGAGDIDNAPGIAGLSDAPLQSGLPDGFDPRVWGSNPRINSGYPYLLANPPR